MRWSSHKLTTLLGVYALTGEPASAAVAAAGSVLPDLLELGILRHRGITHWPWPYLALLALLWRLELFRPAWWCWVAFFLVAGCLCHLAEDFLSVSGIPLGRSWRRGYAGAGLYRTFTPSEGGTAVLLSSAFLALAWFRGFLSWRHLVVEGSRAMELLYRALLHGAGRIG